MLGLFLHELSPLGTPLILHGLVHELSPLGTPLILYGLVHELSPLGTPLILHGLGLYLYELCPLAMGTFNIAWVGALLA